VLWLTTDPTKLSSKGKSAIEDARKNGDGLAISDITLLELATLASKGRILLGISLESYRKSRPGLSSCQSVAVRVRALWGFRQLIQKIRLIELSGPRRWSRV